MIKINPTIYKLGAASFVELATLPLDLIQTKIISNKKIDFKLDEFKNLFYFILIFTFQNSVFVSLKFIKSTTIRSCLLGLICSPFYIFAEGSKLYSRLRVIPKLKPFIFWIIIRQIIVLITLYNLISMNFSYSKIIGPFLANSLGFPLKILAFKKSYLNLNFNKNILKKTFFFEIVKSSIGDGLTLFLIYNYKFTTIK